MAVLRIAAQIPPDWYQSASRRMHYPPEGWYTGYVEGRQQNGETMEAAILRLKDAARVELVSTIRTTVEQSLESRTVSDMQQSTSSFDEQIQETFVSETRICSSIRDLPGLKIETYRNPSDGVISAFAYVKRQTLINQLIKRIALLSGKAENDLEQALQLSEEGQKTQARSVAERGLAHLAQAEEVQNLLAVVDDSSDEETLQTMQTQSLYRQLSSLTAALQNVVAVYLQCETQMFGGEYTALKGEIEGALSETGVSFVSNADEADWAVYVRGYAQEHAKADFEKVSNYAAYVEVHIDIEQKNTGKRIYSSGLTSEIANHTMSFSHAAREAYKKITPEIIKIVKKQTGI